MAVTKIRGNTQIMALTITNAEIATAAAIETTKLADGPEFLKRDGSVVLTGDLNANSAYTVKNLKAPVNDNDAARLVDIQSATAGLDVKLSVRAASTADVDISTELENGDSFGGVTLVTGDRVLLKDQSPNTENGIYVVQASGAAVRSTDFDEDSEVTANAFTFVEEGTHADKGFVVTSDDPIVVGTDSIVWTQFSGAGAGDVNNATNVGTDGTGVFKQLNGSNLEFYKLKSEHAGLTVALDGANDQIDFTLVPGSIDHNSLLNYAVAEHRTINDGGTGATDLWSASKISTELGTKEPTITVLPISKGGTNSGTALNNNRVMVAVGGAIVEHSALGANLALATDANGLPATVAGVSDTEVGYLANVTSDIQTQLDAKEATITVLPIAKGGTNSGAALANDLVMVSSAGAIVESSITVTELGYLDGVTSNVQTQLDAKEPTITTLPIAKGGTNSGIALTNGLVMVSAGGAIVESTISTTELGYLDNVTSDIQSQLNAKTDDADFVVREELTGADGIETDFTLDNTPVAGSEHVYLNGLLQDAGGSDDYTIVGDTITFNFAPLATDKLLVSYRK